MAKNIKGRKFVATAASAALVASAIVPVASAAEFADQSKISSWAADAVAHAVEKGYMQGKDGNKFDPKATITKAEVATVIFNALGLEKATTGTFKDVPASAWYAGAVNALQAEGIVEGSEGKFEPTKDVTLIEAAQMVAKALKIEGTADLSKFADASKVPAWANASIQAMVANGYIEGGEVNGKLSLDPLSKLTRERLATMFVKVAKAELEGGSEETPKPTPTPDAATITTVTAVKANVIEVKFGGAVDTEKTTLKLTKGTAAVSATVAWNEAKTVATFTTTAKLTKGDYTVTLADAEGKALSTGKTAVVDQYVAEIKILNDTALTNASSDVAYIYYDVVDQYGESLKASTAIQWSLSTTSTDNRSQGKLSAKKSNGAVFNYGEKIYVTGVYAKTGVSVTKTLEVGAKQALDKVSVAGFVKKGTNQVLNELPKGFKIGEYYMVFKTADQNGNEFEVTGNLNEDITFISDNVLLVKELKTSEATTLTIAGEEYKAVLVEPGINVSKGGNVTITAIANKTGNKTEFKTAIAEEKILTSFSILNPSALIADGERTVIPFEALDQNGEKITDFTTLAKQETFNKLSLNVSEGTLTLVENNDGSASLVYQDKTVDWSNSASTDGIDRTVSLTSVVIGGNSSNQLLYIQDKARPVAIAAVDMDNVLVEGGSDLISLSSFDFLDQYGRNMTDLNLFGSATNVDSNETNKNEGTIYDNGFFANEAVLNGQDFAGYNFSVRATYKGDTGFVDNVASNDVKLIDSNETNLTVAALRDKVATYKSGLTFKFDIFKAKGTDAQSISPVKNEDLTIVDITTVKNFAVANLGKQYVNTAKSEDLAGDTGAVKLTVDNITSTVDSANIQSTHEKRHVAVVGEFNGEKVVVPAFYYVGSGQKLALTTSSNVARPIAITSPNVLKWSEFYDVTSGRYVRKDGSDLLKVSILDVDSGSTTLDTVSAIVALSDAKPVTTSVALPTDVVLNPTVTAINGLLKFADGTLTIGNGNYKFKDQYGVNITPNYVSIKVSKVEENTNGYKEKNFSVTGNDTQNVSITGAERGDKFVLTITADGVVSTINVTVGADKASYINNSGNSYLDRVVNTLKNQ